MGSGPKRELSPGKASTLLDADGALEAAARSETPASPCEETRRYPAVIFDQAVALGDEASLKLSNPPVVIAGRRVVGELVGPDAAFPLMCLRSGYRLIGVIVALDASNRRGEIELRGVRGSPP
jgi:hypothetical protein